MKIVFTVIRKLMVLGLVLFIGISIAFSMSYTLGGSTKMMSFSASVIAIISFATILTMSSFIGDAVFFKLSTARRWSNLAITLIPNSLFVYFYILDGGQFLQLPPFKTVGNILLYGSIILAFIFWGLDEWSRVLLQKWIRKSKEAEIAGTEKI